MVAVTLSVLAMTSGLAVGQPTHVLNIFAPCAEPVARSAGETIAAKPSTAIELALLANDDAGLIANTPGPDAVSLSPSLSEQPHAGPSLSFDASPMARLGDSVGAAGLTAEAPRPLEFSLVTPTALNVDVAITRRSVSSETANALVTGSGAEVRVGQGLAQRLQGENVNHKGWYLFAASDGRALTWTPGGEPSAPSRGLRLESATEIGDIQAGVAMSSGALKTSLSIVKRTVKSWIGPYKTSADESFAGLTMSWKR